MKNTKLETILHELQEIGDTRNLSGMRRFGIQTDHAFGISIPKLASIAKVIGKDHALSLDLWATGYHEARILAGMIADPSQTSSALLESWVLDFNSWDVCDQICGRLIVWTPYAREKALSWALREEEFVRRAGYTLMACLALRKHAYPDHWYLSFLDHLLLHAGDRRNFVWKAEHWALRQIGKRSAGLMLSALEVSRNLSSSENPQRRKVGKTALRELEAKLGRVLKRAL